MLEEGLEVKNPFGTDPETYTVRRVNGVLTIDGSSIGDWCIQKMAYRVGRKLWNEVPKWQDLLRYSVAHVDYDFLDNWLEIIEHELSLMSTDTLSRLVYFFRPIRDRYELPKVSRAGESSELQVAREDTDIFRFWILLSRLAPGIFCLNASFHLVIRSRLGFLVVRELIIESQKLESEMEQLHIPTWSYPYPLKDSQRQAVDDVLLRRSDDKGGHIIWMEMGQGKTLIALFIIHRLIQSGTFPGYCVYTYPPSVQKSLENELKKSGLPYEFVSPNQSRKSSSWLKPNCVICIQHDHLRRDGIKEELLAVAKDMIFIIDEMHACMCDSIRTSVTLQLASLSRDFIGMTGTLIYDKEVQKVVRWLTYIVPIPVNDKNFYIAAASVVSHNVPLNVTVRETQDRRTLPPDLLPEYLSLVPPVLGGHSQHPNFRRAAELCYRAIETILVEIVERKRIDPSRDIFCVVRNADAAEEIQSQLHKRLFRVFVIGKGQSLNYDISSKERYDVVLAPVRQSMGYTLTRCSLMLTSVYPTNQATREQIRARLVRWGQKKEVEICMLHCGLLTYTLENHEKAASLLKVLKELTNSVN